MKDQNLHTSDNLSMHAWGWGAAAILGSVLSACAVEAPEPYELGADETDAPLASDATPPPVDPSDQEPLFFVDGRAVDRVDPEFVDRDARAPFALAAPGGAETQSYGYLYAEHSIGGGLFGNSYDFVFGWQHCPWGRPREYAEAWTYNQNGPANCSVVRWYVDGNPYDCRVVIHVGARAFSSGTCVTRVWVQ